MSNENFFKGSSPTVKPQRSFGRNVNDGRYNILAKRVVVKKCHEGASWSALRWPLDAVIA